METVGIVGFGAMGSVFFERLRLAGVQPAVYDVQPSTIELARSRGASTTASPAELARVSSLIDIVVRTDEEVLECTLGPGGVLEGSPSGTLLLLHSSIQPETTARVAAAATEHGVSVIDACSSGTPDIVRAGELSFLVGGEGELVQRATPHMLRMAKQVLYMGPLGAGNVAKLIVNLINGSERLVIHEALQIGEAAGIPYVKALEMLRKVQHGAMLDHWQNVFDPTSKSSVPRGGTNTLAKDMPLAAELGRSYGLNLPITEELVKAALQIVAAERAAASTPASG